MDTKEYTYRPRGRNPRWWYGKTPQILTDQEALLLLSTAFSYSYRDYTLILLALNTGLRNSEVRGLNVEDVWYGDAVLKWLDLSAQITKNHKPRSIPLNSDTRSVLEEYLHRERSTG